MSFKARTVIMVVSIQPFMNQPTAGSKNVYSLSSILLKGGHLCCPNAPQDSLAARPGVQTSNACKNLGWEVNMLNNLVMLPIHHPPLKTENPPHGAANRKPGDQKSPSVVSAIGCIHVECKLRPSNANSYQNSRNIEQTLLEEKWWNMNFKLGYVGQVPCNGAYTLQDAGSSSSTST